MKVLLDTNALAVPEQLKIDIFEEIKKLIPNPEILTLSTVIDELKKIKDKKAAKVGLELLKIHNVRIIPTEGNVDEKIIETAKKLKAVVFTNDKELKNKCIKQGIPVMFVRKKRIIKIRGLE